MLTDEQIKMIAGTDCAIPGSYVHAVSRAIESAATEPLLERIALLEARVRLTAERWQVECDNKDERIAEMEAKLAQQAEAQEPVYQVKQSTGESIWADVSQSEFDEAVYFGVQKRVLFTRPQPAQLQRLSEEEVHEWWARTNGMEDHDMCKIEDFRDAVRRVETKLAAKNGAELK